ncbi:MAG: hypothetical protein WC741_01820 [Patescibacteria group bacterium]|jgi:hypothetical protein
MKKKKQQIRNLIILSVVVIGIILGLWAMKSSLNPNSNASGKCVGGSFGIFNGSCYEMWPRSCNTGCCSQKVSMDKCKNYEFLPNKKSKSDCPGTGYQKGSGTECFLKDGKVCTLADGTEFCCNKKVEDKFCK